MRPFWKKRHRYTLEELAIRREKKAEVVKSSLPLFAMVLMICMMVLLSLLCMKPLKDLHDFERERDHLQASLNVASKKMERAKMEYFWMVKDPEYFETIARDKNNLMLPNEQIIRIIDAEMPLQ